MTDLKKLAAQSAKAVKQVADRLAELHDQRAELEGERSKVERALVSPAELKDRLNGIVKTAAGRFEQKQLKHWLMVNAAAEPSKMYPNLSFLEDRGRVNGDAFAFFFQEQICGKISEVCASFDQGGLPAAERKKRLAEIDEQIAGIDANLAELNGALEADGVVLGRAS